MKKIKTLFTIAFLAISTIVNAASQGNGVITIKATKASRQLIESWISEYKKVNPEVEIIIVNQKEDANLSVGNNQDEGNSTNVGRYAILPVTPTDNPLIEEVESKEWSEKDLKRLFFQSEDDLYQEESEKSKKEKLADKLTVFSGNNEASVAQAFAQHFGYKKGEIRGKRIAGDDIYLLNAIKKEKQSVTFNNIAYLFDLESRNLKDNITILPLNIKKDQAAVISSGNLDKTIALLENSEVSGIAVQNISLTQNTFNTDIDAFLTWVVTEGQDLNNKAGYLRLNEKDVKKQLNLLAGK